MPFVLSLSAQGEAIFGECRERTTTRNHRQRRTDVLILASQQAPRQCCSPKLLIRCGELSLQSSTKGFRKFHVEEAKLYRVEL